MKTVFFIACILAAQGCARGPNMLTLHAKSSITARNVLTEAGRLIKEQRSKDVKEAVFGKSVDVDQAEINAHQVIRDYEPVIHAYNMALDAYSIWSSLIIKAHDEGKDELPSSYEVAKIGRAHV